MSKNKFPKGWDEQKVQQLLKELESRTDDEWITADEAASAKTKINRSSRCQTSCCLRFVSS